MSGGAQALRELLEYLCAGVLLFSVLEDDLQEAQPTAVPEKTSLSTRARSRLRARRCRIGSVRCLGRGWGRNARIVQLAHSTAPSYPLLPYLRFAVTSVEELIAASTILCIRIDIRYLVVALHGPEIYA